VGHRLVGLHSLPRIAATHASSVRLANQAMVCAASGCTAL